MSYLEPAKNSHNPKLLIETAVLWTPTHKQVQRLLNVAVGQNLMYPVGVFGGFGVLFILNGPF